MGGCRGTGNLVNLHHPFLLLRYKEGNRNFLPEKIVLSPLPELLRVNCQFVDEFPQPLAVNIEDFCG
jgi:hypothetical protein